MLKLDYSKKDYTQLLSELKAHVPLLTDKWNDFLDSDVGYALIQLYAGIADFNNFYLDRQAAETYLSTCTQRSSAIAISKMLGYTPRDTSSATGEITISLASEYNSDIIIPRGTGLSIDNIQFFINNNYIIPAGSLSISAQIKQGKLFSTTYKAPGIKWFKINTYPNISDIKIYVDNNEWERVDSFIYTSNPKCFKVGETRDGRQVIFGSGETSLVPENGAVIRLEGVLSDGSLGNINQSNIICNFLDPITNSNGGYVTNLLSAVMVNPTIDGDDVEPLERIKFNAPAYYTTQHRLTTNTDYTAEAYTIPGVKSAISWGGEEVDRYGEVFVCLYGNDPENVPQSLLDYVKNVLDKKRLTPIIIRTVAPSIIKIFINIDLYTFKFYSMAEVRDQVQISVLDHFRSFAVGQTYQESDIINKLADISGLDYLNMTTRCEVYGQVDAGQLKKILPNHVDLTSLKIYESLTNTLVWSYGDSEITYYKNEALIEVNMPNGTAVTLRFNSLYNDVYPIRDQLIVLGTLNINMYESNNPSRLY